MGIPAASDARALAVARGRDAFARRAFRAARRRSAAPLQLALALLACVGPVPPLRAQSETPAPAARALEPAAPPSAGAALRDAVVALRAGEAARAATLLEGVARNHPVIADHADLLRARALLEAGLAAEAAGAAGEGAQRSPQSPLHSDFFAVLGDALEKSGNDVDARRAWQSAASITQDPVRLAALAAREAASLERSSQPAPAAELWRRLWRDQPTSSEARRAAERLDALERELGQPLRSADDHRSRGDALFRAARSEEALHDYDAALAGGLEPRARRAVMEQRAHCLFRLRRYSEASAAFEALAPDPGAALWRARSIARAGDVPRSIAELEALAERSPARIAQQARWFAALLLDDAGESVRAQAHFEAVARTADDASLASQARWRLGWAAYRRGNDEEARSQLERLATAEPDPTSRLQARYWQARAEERSGADAAQTHYAALAQEYPFTYYGWRARTRLAASPAPGAANSRVPAGTSLLSPTDLARPRILLEAGLEAEAQQELEPLRARAGGLADRLELARLFADARAYDRAQGLVTAAYAEPLARGPTPGDEELWWTAWPLAYAELVRSAAGEASAAEPALVWAIMREESGYRPSAVSPAGARGLLQIMPATGERLAQQVGLATFTPEDLFAPEVNVRLGATYLGDLGRRFGGRLSAAIGSYNAGPEAVARWLEERPTQDDDDWVETIPYEQTRTYVKRVLRSLHAYRVLY